MKGMGMQFEMVGYWKCPKEGHTLEILSKHERTLEDLMVVLLRIHKDNLNPKAVKSECFEQGTFKKYGKIYVPNFYEFFNRKPLVCEYFVACDNTHNEQKKFTLYKDKMRLGKFLKLGQYLRDAI